MREPEWIDDGHTVELVANGDGEPGCWLGSITCPGEKPCQAGWAACPDWDDGCCAGVLEDDDGNESDCPTCEGRGWVAPYPCWLLNGNDNGDAVTYYDTLDDKTPGRYRLLVAPQADGGPEDYWVALKIGPHAPASSPRGEER
jgi:hypothetical protein